jgi:hypothetical protein
VKSRTDSKNLRIFVLIPVLANVLFLAGMPFYRGDMAAGLVVLLLAAPWGIGLLAGRLIDYLSSARAPEDDAPEGFI